MGAYYGAEIAVDLIQDHIKTNIASALANVRASRLDPIVSTEPPKEYFIYANANVYRPPAVFTIFESQKILDADGGNHINAVDHIMVVCVVEDRLERLLTIKAWRYQAAMMQILHLVNLTNSNGGIKLFSRVDSCEFSPIVNLTGKKGEELIFQKEMGLRLLVDHIENLE